MQIVYYQEGEKLMTMLTWILQGLLAAIFVMASLGKIFGSTMHKDNFTKWRLPQWFRVVTGLVELAAALLLVVGYWMAELILYGAWILVAVGLGGVITHLRAKDPLKAMLSIGIFGVVALILALIVM